MVTLPRPAASATLARPVSGKMKWGGSSDVQRCSSAASGDRSNQSRAATAVAARNQSRHEGEQQCAPSLGSNFIDHKLILRPYVFPGQRLATRNEKIYGM